MNTLKKGESFSLKVFMAFLAFLDHPDFCVLGLFGRITIGTILCS